MTTNDWWSRQLIESMKEACKLMECFKIDSEPNVDDFDKAKILYEECCQVYHLKELSFEEFLDFGKSLRARQAHKILEKDYFNE